MFWAKAITVFYIENQNNKNRSKKM